jgi:hypothetical protein
VSHSTRCPNIYVKRRLTMMQLGRLPVSMSSTLISGEPM